jgi:uridine kinase
MEITDYIMGDRYELQAKDMQILAGITGRAGSGKTTLSKLLSKDLKDRGVDNVVYSGDWRFVLDSGSRKQWIETQWKTGMNAYLYAINQFNWWDFNRIYDELHDLVRGNGININSAYNRISGKKDLSIKIHGIERGIVFYENGILGAVEHLEEIDVFILLNTPDSLCLNRIIKKDFGRRSLQEIVTRYLITTFSENIILKILFDKFQDKIVSCDSTGTLGKYPEVHEITHIPVPIEDVKPMLMKKGTVFCDLDGTIIKHVPVPTETGEEIRVISGSADKLKELRQKGYFLVLTTSRPQNKIFGVLEILKNEGLKFDQIVCDLPVGPRHLINDSKNDEIRAFAHVIERDGGIKNINLP